MSRIIAFLIVGWLIVIPVNAQAANTVWTLVEKCVAEATSAPNDWQFEGTLLLRSLGKLHAYNQDWDTPRILVFHTYDIPGTGLLSPDGRWFATIEGVREDVQMIATWQTESIEVHSTINDESYVVEWENFFSAVHRLYGHIPYWLDNEHLLYSMGDDTSDAGEQWFIINPFTQEVTPWEGNFSPSRLSFSLSPDGEKALHHDWGDLFWILENGETQIEIPIFANKITWHPDSTSFAGYTFHEDNRAVDQLVIFDLNGDITDTVFTIPSAIDYSFQEGYTWSPDGRYLVFASERIYIADIQEEVVYDTCIPSRSVTVAWSPSSTQFAFIERYYTDREIQIFDIGEWVRYVVGYHSGEVIGWRNDD